MFNVYQVLTPIALSLVFFELLYCFITKKKYFTFQDSMSSFATAIGNQIVNLMVAALVIKGFGYLHDNYALTKIPTTWPYFLLLLVIMDFLFYWFHRWGHSINILWAAHSPHHSAEEMNLAVALRASVTQRIFSFSVFWPLPLIGFDPVTIYTATGIHLILGYWHHTRVIPKLGWFEKYFNTPSHHRVHHGTNEQYLDKNYAEIFIIWDKMFGTFAEEKEEVNYGILRHPKSWGPLQINFHFWGLLFQDAMETKSWWNKIRLWFMPLGWRPADVSFREPVKPYDVHEYKKFKTPMFKGTKPYLICQLLLGLPMMAYVINGSTPLQTTEKIFMGTLIWAMIISWGAIMERKTWGVVLEYIRLAVSAIAIHFFAVKYHQVNHFLWIAPMILLFSYFWMATKFRNNDLSKSIPV